MQRFALTAPIITFRDPLLVSPFVRWCIIVAMSLLGGAWVAVLGIPHLPGNDVFVVHYTTTFGIDALGGWRDLFRLPLTGTALLGVNLTLARLLATGSDAPVSPASQTLIIANIPLQFAVLLGSVLLWKANT